ncbi:MAG: hypothetical protein GY798_26675 [Hyphomicrobiales bacterium]|nr:hypothetical protein [Hyphomicrobiales bacterium]
MAPDSAEPEPIGNKLNSQGLFGGRFDRDNAITVFERNAADVQSAFNDEGLLTFAQGDGWAPLYRFLDCPVPDESFPHTNRGESFHQRMAEQRSTGGVDSA